MDLTFLGIPLAYNGICLVCLVGFLYKSKMTWKQLDFKPLLPFIILYVLQLAIIPFQSGYPNNDMLIYWRTSFMGTLLTPFFLWNGYIKDMTIVKPLRKTLIVCLIIISIYALFLTTIPGINPYLIAVLPIGGKEFNEAYAMGGSGASAVATASVVGGRVFGRISSVFSDVQSYGLFNCLAIFYIFYIRRHFKKNTIYIIIIILACNIIFSGVRSSLVGLIIGLAAYMLLTRKFKMALMVVTLAYSVILIVQQIPGMNDYLGSLIDSFQEGKSSVKGSDMDMRIRQLMGSLDIVKDCPIVGKGFSWTSWYLVKHTSHPVCLYFESLIFMIICNNGLLGFFFWGIMIYKTVFKYAYRTSEQKKLCITLLITYISYACVTGDYGYMKYFLIFYLLVLMENPSMHESQLRLHNSLERSSDEVSKMRNG